MSKLRKELNDANTKKKLLNDETKQSREVSWLTTECYCNIDNI